MWTKKISIIAHSQAFITSSFTLSCIIRHLKCKAAKTREQKQQAKNWTAKREEWAGTATGIPGYMNNEKFYATDQTGPFQIRLGEGGIRTQFTKN